MSTTRHMRRCQGFTLVELVVSICIATIVAAFIVMFIRTPVENYMAQSRRGELITEADLIERNLSQDIHTALPNSTRRDPSGFILELIPIADMAIYRAENTETPAIANDELSFTGPDTRFKTLGVFSQTSIPPACCGTRFRMVIGQNQATASQDLYQGGNVITPPSTSITLTRQSSPTRNDAVVLGAAFSFTSPSLNKHVFLVANPIRPVAYECNISTHTLKRFENYAIAAGVAANRNAATRIGTISNDVSSCTFSNLPGIASRSDLVTINIQLQRSGETQTVFLQQAVENLP